MGDTLNLISIKDPEAANIFKSVIDPTQLLINPKDGLFNSQYGLKRDQITGLNALLK